MPFTWDGHNAAMGFDPTPFCPSPSPPPRMFLPAASDAFGPPTPPAAGPFAAVASRALRLNRQAVVAGLAAVGVWVLVAATPDGQRIELLTWLVMAPLCEEAFFRGLLHEALLRRLGDSPAAVRLALANALVALAFAALHAAVRDPATGVAVILPALLIGRAYGRTRRLLPAVALHASFNLAWLAWGRPGAAALAALAAGVPTAQNVLSILQEWFA